MGLETNNAAADYIQLYNGDKKTLADSLAAIQETSAKILDELLPEKRIPSLERSSTSIPRESRVELPGSSREAPPSLPDQSHAMSRPTPDPPVWDR